jgi:hypothetical protein
VRAAKTANRGKIGPSGADDNAPRIEEFGGGAGADLYRCPAGSEPQLLS